MLALGVAAAVAGLRSAGRRVEPHPLPARPVALARAGGDASRASPPRGSAGGSASHQLAGRLPAARRVPDAQRRRAGRRRRRAARRALLAGGAVAAPATRPRRWPHDRAARDHLRVRRRAGRPRPASTSPSTRASWCWSPGRPASGKSTLLGVVTGLVPRFSGGTLDGDVLLDGVSIVRTPPRERAHAIGYVGQNPAAGFVTDTVEEELAYGMEQLGLPPETMRRRVEETLDLLGIADLRDRDLRTLSGGQQQRVAIGSVLTMHPRLLVLDEPTSALDPTAAEEVLATLTRLVHDLGVSVLLAEHRLERVVPFADRMCLLTGDGRVDASGAPAELLATSPVVPPIVELGRAAGWSPLPLSVRDARRLAARPADRLAPAAGDAPTRRRAPRSPYAGSSVVHGQTVAVREPRPRPRRRPGHRADGPQRLRQVVAAVGDPGQRTAYGGPGRRRRQRPGRARPGRPPRAGRAGAAERRRPALPRDRRRGVRGRRRRHRRLPRAARPAGARHPRRPAPPRPLRGAAARARARAGARRRGRRCCCSTSRPAASTTPPSACSPASCAGSPPTATPCWSPPTTWSSWPRSPTTSSCSPTGEVVSSGPVRRVVAESPAFAPQVTKVLGAPWLRVDEVVAAAVSTVSAAVRISPRSAAGARRRVVRRADDAVLAAAPAGRHRGAGGPAVPLPGAAADRDRGGARRAQRGRPRPAGARRPRRAQRGQRDPARHLAGHGGRRADVLPADPRRPGLRARASASCWAAPRSSRRR